MTRKPKPKPVLGLDISTSSVKVVELAKSGSSYRVVCYAIEPMPANAIQDKVILDIDEAGAALKRAYKRSGSRLKEAATALGGATVINKSIQLPEGLTDFEFEEQVEFQAGQHIPFPVDEVAYDFEVKGPASDGSRRVDALLVATRRDNVEHRQAVLEIARLRPYILDCEAFALENAYDLLRNQLIDQGRSRTVALVDFGSTNTTFSVFHDNAIVYTRDQAFGGRQLTEDIMRRYEMTYEDASRAVRHGGLPDDYREALVLPFIDDMAQQINRAQSFYLASTSVHHNLDQIVICGGCAMLAGASERIAGNLKIPTVVANPFKDLKLSSKARAQGIERDAPMLMVACGLALRSFS